MIHHLRGHTIWLDAAGGWIWRYADNDEPTAGNDRPCGKCHEPRTAEGHDPCLGVLDGVVNACCGHGHIDEAYVQFVGGRRLAGQDALDWAQLGRANAEVESEVL